MKNFWKEKGSVILLIVFVLIVIFLVDVKCGPGYEKQSQEKEFNSESFFDNLKVVSGTIFQGPSQELYTQYGNFLDSTDEYLKLETYDFTNKFFKTRFQNLSNRGIPTQLITEKIKYDNHLNITIIENDSY